MEARARVNAAQTALLRRAGATCAGVWTSLGGRGMLLKRTRQAEPLAS
jgi:hypothetical protein